VELGVAERIILLHVLPKEGDLLTLRIVRDLQSALSFKEDEHKLYNIRVEGNKTFWDNDDKKSEIEIGDKGKEIIRTAIKNSRDLRVEWLESLERLFPGL